MTKRQFIDSLDAFTTGYIECALWSSTDESRDDGGDPLDQNYDIKDFTLDALTQIKKDCDSFQDMARDLLIQYYYQRDTGDAGHDFWLTRNRHGAGFWDRGMASVGDKLTEIAHSFGECHIFVNKGKLIVE